MAKAKAKQSLPSGRYMEKQEVLDYVYHVICRSTLGWMIPRFVRTYTVDDKDWLRTDDIENIMVKPLFREMECTVPTLIVL